MVTKSLRVQTISSVNCIATKGSSKTSCVNSTTKCAVNTKSVCVSLRNDKGASNNLGEIDGRTRTQKGKDNSPARNI